jgi:DNA-binding SARP family transcriptional activator
MKTAFLLVFGAVCDSAQGMDRAGATSLVANPGLMGPGRDVAGAYDAAVCQEVLRRFPYGILVLDATGTIRAANDRAQALLPQFGLEPPMTCCAVLGCRRSEPLEAVCVTAMARELGRALPETRIDLPGSPARAVWLTASPIGDGHPHVIVQIRPGHPEDRRRRTDPHWTGQPRLRISVLGPMRVESREGSLGGEWLLQRPGQVLKYLICERDRTVPVEEIAAAIWPDGDPRALDRVRHLVHQLRHRLDPGRVKRTGAQFVLARGAYVLDLSSITVDADEFELGIRVGLAAYTDGDVASARRALARALALYEDDLLPEDPYAVWASVERERLRDLASRAFRILAELDVAEGRLADAHAHLDRLTELEPFDLPVQRQLIEVCLRQGLRSQAVRRYTALRMRFLREFGADLDFELSDLLADGGSQLPLI